ncbi:MAG: radical SAM protein [Kiritimatiellae bacterium]|nr:radical SAM protein [Kiritimatiellia bacterium]
MIAAALFRIARGCSFRVQRNLLRFAWNGRKAVKSFERRQRKNKPFFPAFLMLSITNRCNLRCRGCWVTPSDPPQTLSLSQLDGIIACARRYGSAFFGILGGEPFFHPDLFTLFETHPDAYFQLFTNGTMLTDETAARLAACGNVTPLISIEGLETESRIRRGQNDVFARSLAGLRACVKAELFTGVAASINRRNFDELVSTEYLDFLVKEGVHYIWYYIYRPCGNDPDTGNALDRERILALRRFIVEQRCRANLFIIDAYWDADGRAVCPGTMGLSHHIAPNGAVEFCPIIQTAGTRLAPDASNLEAAFQSDPFLGRLRAFSIQTGRKCILMEKPQELGGFLTEQNVQDSSGRAFLSGLAQREPLICHDLPGDEIPERSLVYRLMKRSYFFGFGAYG